MAPEVVLHQPYNRRCDVFSFAIVAWEVATGGKVPYGATPTLRVAIGVAKARSRQGGGRREGTQTKRMICPPVAVRPSAGGAEAGDPPGRPRAGGAADAAVLGGGPGGAA